MQSRNFGVVAMLAITTMSLSACAGVASQADIENARTQLGRICATANSAQATLAIDVPKASEATHRRAITHLALTLDRLSARAEATAASADRSELADIGRSIQVRLLEFEAALRNYVKAVPLHGSTSTSNAGTAFAEILASRDALTVECALLAR